jgi:hypothetical protein
MASTTAAPTLDAARARPPDARPLAALASALAAALPDALACAADYERLAHTLFSIVHAVDAAFKEFALAALLPLDGDAATAAAATHLEARLDAYAQNHARALAGTSRFVLRGRACALSFETLLFVAGAACALTRSAHALRRGERMLGALRVRDICVARSDGRAARLARADTPLLRMSARELVQHFFQFERVFRTLAHSHALLYYVDLLRLRTAMLLRSAHLFAAFDDARYATLVAQDAAVADAAAATQNGARYRASELFVQDAAFFFIGVDARLYTAALWPRATGAVLAALLAAATHGRFALAERAERVRALLRRACVTMTVETVNAQFRTHYMAHATYLSERRRFARDKPMAAPTAAKVIKGARGLDAVNEMLVLADTDAAVALDPARTPFDDDPGAVDLMQLRIVDAYAQSFFRVRFDDAYVFYAGEVLEHYQALRNAPLPMLVQTFARVELLWRNTLYVCADAAEALAAWLALVSVAAPPHAARRPDGVSFERFYVDAWGVETAHFAPAAGAADAAPPDAWQASI